jgi:hypothetical protein
MYDGAKYGTTSFAIRDRRTASLSRSVFVLACLLRLQCGCGPPLLGRDYDSLETLVSNYFPALPFELSGL